MFPVEQFQLFYSLNYKKSKASDNFQQVHVLELNKRTNVTHIDMSYRCVAVMSLRYKLFIDLRICKNRSKSNLDWSRSGEDLARIRLGSVSGLVIGND